MDTNPIVYQPGSVYMLHDLVYSKQKNEYPGANVKTIRFDRPCIILSVSKDQNVATVIPLTTKENVHHTVYPTQIEEDKLSYAIMSQITTVETTKLMYFIGSLKAEVFCDIKAQYMKYLDGENISRQVAVQYNKLDVYRLYPFHIYYNQKLNKYRLCLRLDTSSIIFIKVNPMIISKVEFKRNIRNCTIIGTYSLDSFELVQPNLGCFEISDWKDIGFEFNEIVRDSIVDKCRILLGVNVFNNFKVKNDSTAELTQTLTRLFGVGQDYIMGRELIDSIINSKNELQEFNTNPILYITKRAKITKNISKDTMRYIMQVLFNHILGSIDILRAPISCLETMKRHYPEILKKAISPFVDIFYDTPGTKLFDGTKLHNKYTMDNMTWLHNFLLSK